MARMSDKLRWEVQEVERIQKQMVIDDILVELARRVYIEIKGAVIARAWKKSKRRLENRNRKGRSGRVFLTQGGVSSPRRKMTRSGGPRNGLTSDPSSYSSPRSVRGANKGKAGGASGFASPALANIVSAATTTATAAATTTADGERRDSLQSTDPPPLSLPSCRNAPSKDDTSDSQPLREKLGAPATPEAQEDGGERPKPLEPSAPPLAARSPDEGVRRFGSPKSKANCNSGGGGGKITCGRTEDAVVDVGLERKPSLQITDKDDAVVQKVMAPQPRRPSGSKPSRRTTEGQSSRGRPRKLTPGGESGPHRPPSTTPDNSSGKSLPLVAAGERGMATGAVVVRGEAPFATAVANTSQDSVNRSDPRGRGASDRRVDIVGSRGDGVNDDDDLGYGDKVSSPFGGSELGEAKLSKEDYASDTFESVGELSLTQ
eukprot:g10208.t1